MHGTDQQLAHEIIHRFFPCLTSSCRKDRRLHDDVGVEGPGCSFASIIAPLLSSRTTVLVPIIAILSSDKAMWVETSYFFSAIRWNWIKSLIATTRRSQNTKKPIPMGKKVGSLQDCCYLGIRVDQWKESLQRQILTQPRMIERVLELFIGLHRGRYPRRNE